MPAAFTFGLIGDCSDAVVAHRAIPFALDLASRALGIELDAPTFFVGTLFQPERAALRGRTPPLVVAFLEACSARRADGRAR